MKKSKVLNQQELKLVSQVLYNSKWNGQEWNQTIMPLINKLAKMIDVFKKEK